MAKYKIDFKENNLEGDSVEFPIIVNSYLKFERDAIIELNPVFYSKDGDTDYYEAEIKQGKVSLKINLGPKYIKKYFKRIIA